MTAWSYLLIRLHGDENWGEDWQDQADVVGHLNLHGLGRRLPGHTPEFQLDWGAYMREVSLQRLPEAVERLPTGAATPELQRETLSLLARLDPNDRYAIVGMEMY